MKPPAFEYHVADSLDQALSLLADYGDEAKPLAGGQSLIPLLNFRLARPAALIDLNHIDALKGITRADGALRIGAMTRQHALERDDLVRRYAPLIVETMPHVAHPQIRNRGTLGGSLAHAEPAAELPAVMITLGARLHLRSKRADRWLSADEFFTGLFATALQTGELLTTVEIPTLPERTGYA
ncbi:MAG TPA: FAD binding domain-containing protein, partial [Gemmatimonadaceae bacterium]